MHVDVIGIIQNFNTWNILWNIVMDMYNVMRRDGNQVNLLVFGQSA